MSNRGCRVYIGNMPSGVREKDLERFFKKFGRPNDFLVKQGFGFVEFDDYRDADDAVYELNGKVSTCIVVLRLSSRNGLYCIALFPGVAGSEGVSGTCQGNKERPVSSQVCHMYHRHSNKIEINSEKQVQVQIQVQVQV